MPDFGQIRCIHDRRMIASGGMESVDGFGALVEHLERTTRLSRAEAERVVAEVLDYFSESLEGFVTRRHAELQAEELKNAEIFARILSEARQRRFAAPALSERQVRRMVYG
jgi:hypothetical protein